MRGKWMSVETKFLVSTERLYRMLSNNKNRKQFQQSRQLDVRCHTFGPWLNYMPCDTRNLSHTIIFIFFNSRKKNADIYLSTFFSVATLEKRAHIFVISFFLSANFLRFLRLFPFKSTSTKRQRKKNERNQRWNPLYCYAIYRMFRTYIAPPGKLCNPVKKFFALFLYIER